MITDWKLLSARDVMGQIIFTLVRVSFLNSESEAVPFLWDTIQ